jgi:hypothetical protein
MRTVLSRGGRSASTGSGLPPKRKPSLLFGGGRLRGSTPVDGLASPVPGKVAGGGRNTFSSASNRNVRTHSVTKPSPAWAVRSMTTNREQT